MTSRSNQSIMFVRYLLVLCWTALAAASVQFPTPSDQLLVTAGFNVSCECQFFVQSWKTSHMIRLPMGIEPVRLNSSQTADSEACVILCQKQLPPLPDDKHDANWSRIFKGACRTLLVNEYSARHSGLDRMAIGHHLRSNPVDQHPVRGCLQAYARSSETHVWVPMGLQYRKLLSCSHSRHRRSLTGARKMSSATSSMNSVDAQMAVNAGPVTNSGFPTIRPPMLDGPDRIPTTLNTTPLRMILKRLGVFGPMVESLVDMLDGGGLRDLLDTFKLGSYVDRYQRLADDYTEEFDAGHCFVEYLTYTVFNNRFSTTKSSGRGLEEDAFGLLLNAATAFLKNDNASQVLTSLFSMIPQKPASVRQEPALATAHQSAPDVQEVAMNIARFYLRNYFSSLSGSTVRVDEQDPTNNPESLADMIEQVSRPVFLSVFGVVPGVPAAGKLDHLLLMADKDHQRKPPQSRNKLVPIEPVRVGGQVVKTGNPFFDFGNQVVSTFQRASDATHGLYCVKQYVVNKMWDGFRGSMRRMMRAISSVG